MLENLKSIFLFIVGLVIVGLLGYWAVRTIEPADLSLERQKVIALQSQNDDLQKQVATLTNQVSDLERQVALAKAIPAPAPQPPAPKPVVSKYQTLINSLQALINNKIYLKAGSQSTAVGTIQQFLNAYNKISNPIDNDYGASTKTAIANFQKAVGLTADGQTGPTTYQAMINWLKKQ